MLVDASAVSMALRALLCERDHRVGVAGAHPALAHLLPEVRALDLGVQQLAREKQAVEVTLRLVLLQLVLVLSLLNLLQLDAVGEVSLSARPTLLLQPRLLFELFLLVADSLCLLLLGVKRPLHLYDAAHLRE